MRQQHHFSWVEFLGLAITIIILWIGFDYIASIKG